MYAVSHLLALVLSLLGAPHVEDPGSHPRGVWPLQPRPTVVRSFDPPDSDYGRGHRGVDLLGRPGQPVLAAAPGVVAFVGRIAGRGVVTIAHGRMRTTYEPVAPVLRVGVPVLAGTPIGFLQQGGSHCFPRACLHWGLIEGLRTYRDPLLLVGRVRLLPLGPATRAPWSSGSESSGPRVRLPVGLAQAVGGHVGVDLGRGQ